ncbi:MAG TPA: NUDIX domain-containing protein [Gemmatimonadales bacterium]|nr:NUDIX domain-containing protein [Gemmatimonadales bacterium]
MALSYCASCGSRLTTRPSRSGDAVRQHCPTCEISVYETPYVVVATLPVIAERVVLVRRATEPGRGRWAYPGGYLEMGETLEEGAVRETREETGLDVQITGLLGVYSRPAGRTITVVFEAAAESERWQSGPEAMEVGAFAAAEIPWPDLAFWTATYALEDWVHARERGLVLPRAWRIGPPRL